MLCFLMLQIQHRQYKVRTRHNNGYTAARINRSAPECLVLNVTQQHGGRAKCFFSFQFDGDNQRTTAARNMKVYIEIDYNSGTNSVRNTVYKSTITNTAIVRKSEVLPDQLIVEYVL